MVAWSLGRWLVGLTVIEWSLHGHLVEFFSFGCWLVVIWSFDSRMVVGFLHGCLSIFGGEVVDWSFGRSMVAQWSLLGP